MMAMMRFGLCVTVLDVVGEGGHFYTTLLVRGLAIRGERRWGWE
jgi:hypothetical protein